MIRFRKAKKGEKGSGNLTAVALPTEPSEGDVCGGPLGVSVYKNGKWAKYNPPKGRK